MCRKNGFSATVDEVETEQIESQFNYMKTTIIEEFTCYIIMMI